MRTQAAWLVLAMTAMSASAGIRTETVEYKHGDVVLQGYFAWDDASKEKLPGVLVAHEWWGLNDYAKKRAEQLAGLGYAAFAIDMYGKGQSTTDPKEAGKLAGGVKRDRNLMRARAAAGLEALKARPEVDGTRVAAIGYCFGGTVVLELARSGAEIVAVVSFHGGLDDPNPADSKKIKARVLICHGADDPVVPMTDVEATEKNLREAGVDWQVVIYGGAVHAFTNPAAGNDNSAGAAYNEKADRRSWELMKSFLSESFSKGK